MSSLRRLALPLSLSLLAHLLLLAGLSLLPGRSPTPGAEDPEQAAFSLTLVSLDSKKPRPQPPPVHDEQEWQPILLSPPVKPTGAGSLPAAPAGQLTEPGGAAGPGAGVARPNPTDRGLFRAPADVRSVVYLIDRSMSMGPSGALATGKREIIASLRKLPPSACFQIIPYNRQAEPLVIAGRRNLAPATRANIEQAIRQLDDIHAAGATSHARALSRALLLRPQIVFLATDADDLLAADVISLSRLNQAGTILHVVELSSTHPDKQQGPLADLAHGNGGSYRCVPPRP